MVQQLDASEELIAALVEAVARFGVVVVFALILAVFVVGFGL